MLLGHNVFFFPSTADNHYKKLVALCRFFPILSRFFGKESPTVLSQSWHHTTESALYLAKATKKEKKILSGPQYVFDCVISLCSPIYTFG